MAAEGAPGAVVVPGRHPRLTDLRRAGAAPDHVDGLLRRAFHGMSALDHHDAGTHRSQVAGCPPLLVESGNPAVQQHGGLVHVRRDRGRVGQQVVAVQLLGVGSSRSPLEAAMTGSTTSMLCDGGGGRPAPPGAAAGTRR